MLAEPARDLSPAFRVTATLSPPCDFAPSCDARGAVTLPSHAIATSLSVTSSSSSPTLTAQACSARVEA